MVAQLGGVPRPEQQGQQQPHQSKLEAVEQQQKQLALAIKEQLAAELQQPTASSSQPDQGNAASFAGTMVGADSAEEPLRFELSDSPPKGRSVRRRTGATSLLRGARGSSPSPRGMRIFVRGATPSIF